MNKERNDLPVDVVRVTEGAGPGWGFRRKSGPSFVRLYTGDFRRQCAFVF